MINRYRVRQARELARLTQVELAEAVGTVQSSIAQLESGRMQPSESLLEAIASRLGFPVAFFSRGDPPNFPQGTLLFRAHATMPAMDKDEITRLGQIAFEMSVVLSKKVRNKISLRLPQLSDEPTDYSTAAQLTRNALGLSRDVPIPNLVRAVEQSGTIVLTLPARFDTCDAFSSWAHVPSSQVAYDMKKPLVVLSGETPGDRLRSSLAHEIGHLVLHPAVRGTAREMEDEAYKFGAELLLPEVAMRAELTSPVTLTSLSKLKPVWGVSIQMLIRRAYELDIITERQYKYLSKQINARGWRKEEPISLCAEKPRALRQMAEIVYGNPINYQRFAQDLGMHPHFVKRMLGTFATREEYGKPTTVKREEIERSFESPEKE